MAAKLAVGYTLDEIPNDITKKTPACFEPTIDYCVVKIPRFTFEKFAGADPTLTTAMKSVGEAMSIGRTFKEALQKGLRSMEIGLSGFNDPKKPAESEEQLIEKLRIPNPDRIVFLKQAISSGMTLDEIYAISAIDRWFLYNLKEIIDFENGLKTAANAGLDSLDREMLLAAKEYGFSDRQLAVIFGTDEFTFRNSERIKASNPFTNWWTRAAPSLKLSPRIIILLMRLKMRAENSSDKPRDPAGFLPYTVRTKTFQGSHTSVCTLSSTAGRKAPA